MRRIEFIVLIDLDDNQPPGDECEDIKRTLIRDGFAVHDVGWIAQMPKGHGYEEFPIDGA